MQAQDEIHNTLLLGYLRGNHISIASIDRKKTHFAIRGSGGFAGRDIGHRLVNIEAHIERQFARTLRQRRSQSSIVAE